MSNLYTPAQCIASILYLTGYNARVMAKLLPELIKPPVIIEEDAEGKLLYAKDETTGIPKFVAELGDSQDWYHVLSPDYRIPQDVKVPADASQALKWASTYFGDAFIILNDGDSEGGSKQFWVSPLLGVKLGDGGGGQLNLYAEVVYRLLLLLQSWRPSTDKVWKAEWAQWKAAHAKVIRQQLRGEEASEQVSGLVAKAARATGAFTAKIGTWMARLLTKNVGKQTIKPGGIYVSTANPLSRLAGQTACIWRNPVLVLQWMEIIAIGPKSIHCPNPTWETEKDILPNTKIYLHPEDPSSTGGDVDGDGMQLCTVEWCLNWAIKNWHVIQTWPGLAESIVHHFLEEIPMPVTK